MNLVREAYHAVDNYVLVPVGNLLGEGWDSYTGITDGIANRALNIAPSGGRNPHPLKVTLNKIIRVALAAIPVVFAHFASTLGYATFYGMNISLLTVAAYALYTSASRTQRVKSMDESIAFACAAEVVQTLVKSVYFTLTTGIAATAALPIRAACLSVALCAYFANHAAKPEKIS